MLLPPRARGAGGIGNERHHAWVRGRVAAQNRGVDLAGEQHAEQLLAGSGAVHVRRIAELRDVRLFERDPGDAIEIDAPVFRQDAAEPGHRRHGVRANADTTAGEIARRQRTALAVVDEIRMLKTPEHDGGQQHERLAVRLRDQERHDRQLGDVELQVAHRALEAGRGGFYVGELELDEGRLHVATPNGTGDGVVAEQSRHREAIGHAVSYSAPSV